MALFNIEKFVDKINSKKKIQNTIFSIKQLYAFPSRFGIYLSFAIILIIGLLRNRSLLQSLMGSTLAMEDRGWMLLTKRIIIFFISLAFLNELVWRYFGQDQWVNFKTFGMPVLSLIFFAFQYRLFQKYLVDKEN